MLSVLLYLAAVTVSLATRPQDIDSYDTNSSLTKCPGKKSYSWAPTHADHYCSDFNGIFANISGPNIEVGYLGLIPRRAYFANRFEIEHAWKFKSDMIAVTTPGATVVPEKTTVNSKKIQLGLQTMPDVISVESWHIVPFYGPGFLLQWNNNTLNITEVDVVEYPLNELFVLQI